MTDEAPSAAAPLDPYNLSPDEIRAFMEERGEPSYRTDQVVSWIDQGVDDPNAMTNLPLALRDTLSERFCADTPATGRAHRR